ncbi:MAG: hypothetical protein IPK79_03590 [Vampirovibrionales bacterium]|nr:hypothetical protein [Vampirovibrionales bacterium]
MRPVFGSNGLGEIRFGHSAAAPYTQDLGGIRLDANPPPWAGAVAPVVMAHNPFAPLESDQFVHTMPPADTQPVDNRGGFLGRLYRMAASPIERAWEFMMDLFSPTRSHEHLNM